jgi:hypothetical protein
MLYPAELQAHPQPREVTLAQGFTTCLLCERAMKEGAGSPRLGELTSLSRIRSRTKIVKDVVDIHRGTIAVESTVGVGTTFELLLPLNPADPAREP